MKTNHFLKVVSGLIMLGMLLSSCGGPVVAEEPVEPPLQTAAPTATGVPEPEKFTVGISNPITNKLYHTQMLDDLILVNQEYVDAGIANELIIESADTDVEGQIQQLETLMVMKVDAIIVYPLSVTELNPTLEKAVAEGTIVISVDRELDVPGVYTVGIDQKAAAMKSAEWLAYHLIGKGNIIIIAGSPEDPATIARMEGVEEVFDKYPDMNVLAREIGDWDQDASFNIMSQILENYPDLDGYWTDNHMALGALQAVIAANPKPWPLGVGAGDCRYLDLAFETQMKINPNFFTMALGDQPGVAATGLRIAYKMLQGKNIDPEKLGSYTGMKFIVPIVGLDLNLGHNLCIHQPEGSLLDDILTEEEIQKYFN